MNRMNCMNCMNPYIRGGDALLRDYCGPVEIHDGEDWASAVALDWGPPGGWPRVYAGSGAHDVLDPRRLRLDATRSEVRDHVARVMAAGVMCPICRGATWVGCDCMGTGYLRRPAPIEHLLDRYWSTLTAEQSAALVAWSARSWLRGGPVLRGVAVDWAQSNEDEYRELIAGTGLCRVWARGWQGPNGTSGPETGAQGRACADRAILAAHIAYIDNGSVVLPEEPE